MWLKELSGFIFRRSKVVLIDRLNLTPSLSDSYQTIKVAILWKLERKTL